MSSFLLRNAAHNTWSVSRTVSDEHTTGRFESFEQAVKEGPTELGLKPGDTFFVWTNFCPVTGIDADTVIDEASARTSDDCGEIADDWLLDVTKEQRKDLDSRLEKVLKGWLEDNGLVPTFWRCDSPQIQTYHG